MVSVCGNRNTSQNAVQKYFSEVHDLFIDASIKFSSLNDGVLRQKEYCRVSISFVYLFTLISICKTCII